LCDADSHDGIALGGILQLVLICGSTDEAIDDSDDHDHDDDDRSDA
jgi:hypothetical protein